MTSFGYFLSSEEFGPRELVRQARLAEQAGFERLWISDHFHPWLGAQGQSPFVWSVIGALSEAVSLPVTRAVTCPTVRIQPAIIAQAAATAAVQHEGRFVLGWAAVRPSTNASSATRGRRSACGSRCSRRPWSSSGPDRRLVVAAATCSTILAISGRGGGMFAEASSLRYAGEAPARAWPGRGAAW